MTRRAREREVAHLRQVIGTAKVVVALTAAIAATFVAGTLQDKVTPTHWDHASLALMAPTLLISFWLVTRPVPPHVDLDAEAFEKVKKQARRTHFLTELQVGFSALSCIAAAMGLLWPCTWH